MGILERLTGWLPGSVNSNSSLVPFAPFALKRYPLSTAPQVQCKGTSNQQSPDHPLARCLHCLALGAAGHEFMDRFPRRFALVQDGVHLLGGWHFDAIALRQAHGGVGSQ